MSQHKTPIQNYTLWEEKIKYFESLELTDIQKTWAIPDGKGLGLVIVEPRKHPWMKAVLKNVASVYGGSNVGLYIVHGSENQDWLTMEVCKDWKNVQYINLKVVNISIEQYNILFTTSSFYEKFNCKHILVFQTDTFLRYAIPDHYFNFDYVGAPWSHRHTTVIPEHSKIGNGGFSLRRVSAMIDVCKLYRRPANLNEDVFFAQYVDPNRKPTEESAAAFSVEHIFHPNPCGMHQAWRFHRFDQIQKLLIF